MIANINENISEGLVVASGLTIILLFMMLTANIVKLFSLALGINTSFIRLNMFIPSAW